MSGDPQGKDIDQPNGNKLDGICGVPWFRAQWREWIGYNTLLCCYGVKIGTTHRAIKWVELRQTNGTWAKYQEGVFNPDTKSRWVASMAMDDYGNIGISYARSSIASGDFPSCGFTGRLKNDALGQMTFAETIVPGGTGNASQSTYSRYGDYSHTTVDPFDGCTFWSTVEYFAGTAPKSRIWSYQLQTCSGASINDQNNELLSQYNIYQSNNELKIDASKLISDKEVQVDLYDINGKLVARQKMMPVSKTISTEIDINTMAKGVYFVRLGNLEFQKIIKTVIQ